MPAECTKRHKVVADVTTGWTGEQQWKGSKGRSQSSRAVAAGLLSQPRHYFAERAPKLQLLVATRRRSIRHFTRLAASS